MRNQTSRIVISLCLAVFSTSLIWAVKDLSTWLATHGEPPTVGAWTSEQIQKMSDQELVDEFWRAKFPRGGHAITANISPLVEEMDSRVSPALDDLLIKKLAMAFTNDAARGALKSFGWKSYTTDTESLMWDVGRRKSERAQECILSYATSAYPVVRARVVGCLQVDWNASSNQPLLQIAHRLMLDPDVRVALGTAGSLARRGWPDVSANYSEQVLRTMLDARNATPMDKVPTFTNQYPTVRGGFDYIIAEYRGRMAGLTRTVESNEAKRLRHLIQICDEHASQIAREKLEDAQRGR